MTATSAIPSENYENSYYEWDTFQQTRSCKELALFVFGYQVHDGFQVSPKTPESRKFSLFYGTAQGKNEMKTMISACKRVHCLSTYRKPINRKYAFRHFFTVAHKKFSSNTKIL